MPLCILVVVHAVEAVPIPLKVAVRAVAAEKAELGPRAYALGTRGGAVAVCSRHLPCVHRLECVGAHALVKHHIGKHVDARVAQRGNGGKVVLARAVLRAHRTLLVELAQVVKVVHAVAHVVCAGHAFIRGWQPHRRYALACKETRVAGQGPPVPAIGRQVPRKGLHHRAVHAIASPEVTRVEVGPRGGILAWPPKCRPSRCRPAGCRMPRWRLANW